MSAEFFDGNLLRHDDEFNTKTHNFSFHFLHKVYVSYNC